MTPHRRWLAVVLALTFLGLILFFAWRQDPHFWRSAPALYELAQEADRQGDLPQALTLTRQAWSRDPGNSAYGTSLGWLYLKALKPHQALEVFRLVWDRDPQATGALKGLAQALDLLGQRPEALELLAHYLQTHPDDAGVLQFAAELAARRREDRVLAVTYYQRLYRLLADPEVRRRLLDLLTTLGRFAEAIPLQEEEVAQFPGNQEALERLALLHYWQRDYQAATEVYKRLLEWTAEDTRIRRQAAQTAEAAKNLDEALKHYLWLYGRYQGKAEYALALARLWSQKGNHAEAAAVLAPLMQDKPEADLRRWYALELLLTGDFAQARQAYRQAWEAGDTHQETIINLARLYAQNRQFDQAAAMWEEAGRRQLLKGDLLWEAALAYSYARRYREAVAILEPVARDHPGQPRLLAFLGQMHFYQKHWPQAAQYFRAYLDKHPDDPEVRRLLAEALAFAPNARDEAISQYGELLKATDDLVLRHRRIGLLLEAGRWQEAGQELKACPIPQDPNLLKDQARLHLWAGNLNEALDRFDRLLALEPQDRQGLLEKARVLIYLQRPPEALEILRTLRLGRPGERDQPRTYASPDQRQLLVTAIAAELARKNWPAAGDWALRLFSTQFPEKTRLPRDWREAGQWLMAEPQDNQVVEPEEAEPLTIGPFPSKKIRTSLTLEEHTWVARALCHLPGEHCLRLATVLMVENLWKNRYDHATLLILASLLPRLPRYEELSQMVRRIPGIRVGSPEYVSALAFFNSGLGRHGGKLDYLLHVLNEYRHHKWPHSPGELLALADLALELGEPRHAAAYYRRALEIKPGDQRLSGLLLQCQLSQKDWSRALATLERQEAGPQTALEKARLYLIRGQYEGVKAEVAHLPETHLDYSQAQLLLVQALRLGKQHSEALSTLERLAGRLPADTCLMEKARILEDLGDKGAVLLYAQIIERQPDSQSARIAAARQARSLGDWGKAYQAYAQALEHAPQDVELLNELEYVRAQMRPQVASRGFPYARGERRPEELYRPWQFSRPDRDLAGFSLFSHAIPWRFRGTALPVLQTETLFFRDSNRLYGALARLAGSFWVAKQFPLHLAVEYRQYRQNRQPLDPPAPFLGLNQVTAQTTQDSTRLRRLEISLGAGPLFLPGNVKLSGDLTVRRYWWRRDRRFVQSGPANAYAYRPPGASRAFIFPNNLVAVKMAGTALEDRNRLFGALQLDFPLGSRTQATLRYSRRDLYDQEPYLYPRLYQSVQSLGEVRLVTYHQGEFSWNHQFRPGLEWRGNVAGAVFSDANHRLTLYQGLAWQAVRQPRMQLEVTPHFYLAAYRQRHREYFSPHAYTALGLGLDFSRQIFRLPTLILQGAVQAVGQRGEWGPALQGLAALEWELVHNFFIDPHVFYFREWVDNYSLFTAGLSLRYLF